MRVWIKDHSEFGKTYAASGRRSDGKESKLFIVEVSLSKYLLRGKNSCPVYLCPVYLGNGNYCGINICIICRYEFISANVTRHSYARPLCFNHLVDSVGRMRAIILVAMAHYELAESKKKAKAKRAERKHRALAKRR